MVGERGNRYSNKETNTNVFYFMYIKQLDFFRSNSIQ